MNKSRRDFVGASIAIASVLAAAGKAPAQASHTATTFICPPCGCSMDGVKFTSAGNCPACGMRLVEARPVSSEDIEFSSAGVALSGTLYVANNSAPAASVVLAHGSGRVERMTFLAYLLASDGFVVLTYDKRGVGKSGGVYEGQDNTSAANLSLLAQDASAALQVLKKRPALSKIPCGLLGISQAGWIVPIAAAKSPSPSFIALWSGPVCTVSEERHFSNWAENDSDFWQKHSTQEVDEYMRSVRYRPDDVDPRTSITQLSLPALWLFGGRDRSIPVALSVARLGGLIRQGKENLQYEIFPDQGHNLADSSRQPSYKRMVSWIKSTASTLREAST